MSEVKKAEQVQETSISVEKSELIPSREAAANWFSLLSFNYLNPLFETGVSTSLEQTDVPDVYPGDDAEEWYVQTHTPAYTHTCTGTHIHTYTGTYISASATPSASLEYLK